MPQTIFDVVVSVGCVERCTLIGNGSLFEELGRVRIDLVVEVVEVSVEPNPEGTRNPVDSKSSRTTGNCRCTLILKRKRHSVGTVVIGSEVHLRRDREIVSEVDCSPNGTDLVTSIGCQLVRRTADQACIARGRQASRG